MDNAIFIIRIRYFDQCLATLYILDVVNHGVNGAVFVNDKEVPEIVSKILIDKDYRKQLSDNAFQTAQRFSSTTFGKSVETLYYDVLKKCNRVIL